MAEEVSGGLSVRCRHLSRHRSPLRSKRANMRPRPKWGRGHALHQETAARAKDPRNNLRWLPPNPLSDCRASASAQLVFALAPFRGTPTTQLSPLTGSLAWMPGVQTERKTSSMQS